MNDVRARLSRLIQEFITNHLPPLIGMMADQGAVPAKQRSQVDRFIRSLVDFRLEDSITRRGRQQVCAVDMEAEPPTLCFNARLLERVDEDEILGALQEPTVQLLGLSPINVDLVLQLRDPDKLKAIYSRATSREGVETIDLTEVPAVLEERLGQLRRRVDAMTRALGDRSAGQGADVQAGLEALRQRGGLMWPGWEDVQSNPFVAALVEDVDAAISEVEGMPGAEVLVELCWESLELSPTSFLSAAARQLRSLRDDELQLSRLLRVLAEVSSQQGTAVSERAEDWPAFEELAEAWSELFRTEQRLLAWTSEGRRTPSLSVFEAPMETLHLDEPANLPWEAPLLAWSTREQKALRDLLAGLGRSIEAELDERVGFSVDMDAQREGPRLARGGGGKNFEFEAAPFRVDDASAHVQRTRRAVGAYFRTMLAQFDALKPEHQGQLLQRLRASYDGYFQDSKAVWNRRFQAWKKLEPRRAFVLMTTELQHLIGATALFDPFETPDALKVRSIPTFNFVVGWPAQRRYARTEVPLVALKCAFDDAPARVRIVEVPESADARCRWLGDQTLTLRTLVEQPTERLMKAIEGDAVGLRLERR